MVLRTFDNSQNPKKIFSENIRKNIATTRKKRSITNKHTDGSLLPFQLASVTGNCRWKVYDSYKLGQNYEMAESKTYHPGWIIRSIELI